MVALICGIVEESPVAMLIDSLRRRGADFLILDQKKLAEQVRLRWQVTDSGLAGNLMVGRRTIDINEIRSVYHRFMSPEDVAGIKDCSAAVEQTRSIMHSLMNLFDILPVRMINRRRPMMSNNSKPYQASLVCQAGFVTPETLITNDARALLSFAAHTGPLIYKSISSVRSIVAPFDVNAIEKIQSLHLLATQFQQKIDGFSVRVHVIGQRLFATKISSKATDYRYASQEGTTAVMKPYELTDKLRAKCLCLSRLCQLSFAGIDLIISPQKVICLEVNPSPGYSYYQERTGQKISDALADYLSFHRDKEECADTICV